MLTLLKKIRPKLLRFVIKNWSILAIIFVISAFFSNLFLPEPSIFITPDYGRSDLLHFNIPLRKMVSDSLKNFELPLWEPNIGQGFPVFDEGQIGLFYIPNLILFGLLPFWLAFNLGYIFTFILAALGTYLLSRSFSLNKPGSYLAAITYSFSPIIILHLHHYNLIQTAALMPWLFWLVNCFFNTKRLFFLMLIPLILSQQLFAGFPQITLYSLTGLLIFYTLKINNFTKRTPVRLKVSSIFIGMIILGFLIAAVQLIATYTLFQESSKITKLSPNKILTDFPFKYKNLLTAADPYILGSPRDASYPVWTPGKWGIFWESNIYFGIVQLVLITLLIIALFLKRLSKTKIKNIAFWIFLCFLGIGLSLGADAPFHPLFSIPPYSYFRVPSRFLIFTFLSVAILASFMITKISNSKNQKVIMLVIGIILLMATYDIFRVWSNYNPIVPSVKLLSSPEILNKINGSGRIYSLGEFSIWNQIFLTIGWQNSTDAYIFFRNFVSPNSNLLFNTSQSEVYAAMITNRQSLASSLLAILINETNQKNKLTGDGLIIGETAQKMLDFSNVNYIITSQKIGSENWELLENIESEDNSVFLYESTSYLPQVFTVSDYKVANTLQDFKNIITKNQFDPSKTVIIEQELPFIRKNVDSKNEARITKYGEKYVRIETDLQNDSIVVLSDSPYPSWRAYVNGKETEILPANINSRAIIVPQGEHVIEYKYEPLNIKLGGIISLVSILFWILILIKTKKVLIPTSS